MATNREQAKQDYLAGMKYKYIANKYGVSLSTVKSWKSRYWSKDPKVATSKKKVATKGEKVATEQIKKLISNDDLTDKQKMFCLYYLQRFNATWAYMQAYDSSYSVARVEGSRNLAKPNVKKQIDELKLEMANDLSITARDIAKEYARQAFADIGDYINFGSWEDAEEPGTDTKGNPRHYHHSYVYLTDKDKVDTSLIKSVHIGKDGVMVELYDKQKAMGELMKYLSNEVPNGENTDDGFIEALNKSAKEVWGDNETQN